MADSNGCEQHFFKLSRSLASAIVPFYQAETLECRDSKRTNTKGGTKINLQKNVYVRRVEDKLKVNIDSMPI